MVFAIDDNDDGVRTMTFRLHSEQLYRVGWSRVDSFLRCNKLQNIIIHEEFIYVCLTSSWRDPKREMNQISKATTTENEKRRHNRINDVMRNNIHLCIKNPRHKSHIKVKNIESKHFSSVRRLRHCHRMAQRQMRYKQSDANERKLRSRVIYYYEFKQRKIKYRKWKQETNWMIRADVSDFHEKEKTMCEKWRPQINGNQTAFMLRWIAIDNRIAARKEESKQKNLTICRDEMKIADWKRLNWIESLLKRKNKEKHKIPPFQCSTSIDCHFLVRICFIPKWMKKKIVIESLISVTMSSLFVTGIGLITSKWNSLVLLFIELPRRCRTTCTSWETRRKEEFLCFLFIYCLPFAGVKRPSAVLNVNRKFKSSECLSIESKKFSFLSNKTKNIRWYASKEDAKRNQREKEIKLSSSISITKRKTNNEFAPLTNRAHRNCRNKDEKKKKEYSRGKQKCSINGEERNRERIRRNKKQLIRKRRRNAENKRETISNERRNQKQINKKLKTKTKIKQEQEQAQMNENW